MAGMRLLVNPSADPESLTSMNCNPSYTQQVSFPHTPQSRGCDPLNVNYLILNKVPQLVLASRHVVRDPTTALQDQSDHQSQTVHVQGSLAPDMKAVQIKNHSERNGNSTSSFVSRHPSFDALLGSGPSLRLLLRDPKGRPLFHEAGIYHASTKSVYLSTNRMSKMNSPGNKAGQIVGIVRVNLSKIPPPSPEETWSAVTHNDDLIHVCEALPECLSMPNGATLWRDEDSEAILWCEQGQHPIDKMSRVKEIHSALVSFTPTSPDDLTRASTRVLLDNYRGQRFSSLNDVVVHHQSGVVFFTDPDYGVGQNFKRSHDEETYAPNALYAWYPPTGEVRLIDDQYDKPNGVTFIPDPKAPDSGAGLLCTTDTGAYTFTRHTPMGTFELDVSRPLCIYTYSVKPASQPDIDPFPQVDVDRRRLLAHSECGAPDGVHPDEKGNLWVGSGDGIHVYDPWDTTEDSDGPLIGKIVLPGGKGVANFCWAGPVDNPRHPDQVQAQSQLGGTRGLCRQDSAKASTSSRPAENQKQKQYRLLLFAEDELWEVCVGVNGRD